MFIEIYDMPTDQTLFINADLIVSVNTDKTACTVKMTNGEEYSVMPIQLEVNLDRIGSPNYYKIVNRLERMRWEAQA